MPIQSLDRLLISISIWISAPEDAKGLFCTSETQFLVTIFDCSSHYFVHHRSLFIYNIYLKYKYIHTYIHIYATYMTNIFTRTIIMDLLSPSPAVSITYHHRPPSPIVTNTCHHNLSKLAITYHHHTHSLTACYLQEPFWDWNWSSIINHQ